MANRERGELSLVAGGTRYTIRVTTNALAELEDFSGKTFDEVLLGMQRGSVKDVRLMLWAMLRCHHEDVASPDDPGLRRVGDVMDAAGGIGAVMKQLKACMKLNAAAAEDAEARPPAAVPSVGAGAASTLTRVS